MSLNPLDSLIPDPPPPMRPPVDRGIVRQIAPLLVQCTGEPPTGLPCETITGVEVDQHVAVLILGGTRLILGAYEPGIEAQLTALMARVAALEARERVLSLTVGPFAATVNSGAFATHAVNLAGLGLTVTPEQVQVQIRGLPGGTAWLVARAVPTSPTAASVYVVNHHPSAAQTYSGLSLDLLISPGGEG